VTARPVARTSCAVTVGTVPGLAIAAILAAPGALALALSGTSAAAD